EDEAVAVVLDAVEVVGDAPPPPLLVDAENHLFADLDEVEGDEDLVNGDQFGAVLAIEVGLALLGGEGVATVGRLLPAVGPDRVGVEETDALETDQGGVLGDDAVPVPEPTAAANVVAAPGGGGVADHARDGRVRGSGFGVRGRSDRLGSFFPNFQPRT